ncbi:MAG TPA: CoF synthetase [Bacillota bacterium]|nr:CoF synthetase [Bacillota bacterium]
MKKDSQQIIEKLLSFIKAYNDSDDAFNQMALELFRFQFEHNMAYKKYAVARKKTPLTIKTWKDIPPIPIQAYKEVTLSSEPIEEAEAVFMTSGTTNKEKKGKNYHPTLSVWDASMVGPFRHFVLPHTQKTTIFVLSPAEEMNQNSSLSRYLTKAVEYCGTEQSQFFFNQDGLDMEGLVHSLQSIEQSSDPVLLMGATFSYVHFLDYCEERNLSFHLPKGSVIFDTGGLKGQAREISGDDFYAWITRSFGIDRMDCINMYGMTELSSQLYDQTIRKKQVEKATPPWVRTVILDPETLAPLPHGMVGVIAHYDLANWNSALAILTEDQGFYNENGLVLLGRIQGSEARGCSIAIDQLLQSQRK